MGNKPGKVVENRCRSLWCSLNGGMDARVPKAWIPLEKADMPKYHPTDDTFAALEKLRKIFTHKMHWKILCEEGLTMISFCTEDILLAAKETAPPNTVPLASMRGKRPIASKKVKVVKKVASSPHPSSTAELPLRPTPAANLSLYSSPIAANPNSSSFSPPDVDLPYEPPSSSLVGKRPSDEDVLQGKEKRSRATSGFFDPPKSGIPPPPFPEYDPMMAA
ncbi:hypothetical protein LIER_20635 [Lithospermum erythrorhizon]|uniref:Uncharacterized protein n=1 Tax=Lithospermum erythrorhizon TaxID=34254 RepID=A0AAV3QQ09_LITER